MRRSSTVLALVVLGALTVACSRKRPEVAPVTPPAAPPASPAPDDRERLERERLERERAEREAARARRAEIERVMSEPIYFGFDRFDLTAEARATLEAKWSLLTANPSLRLLVEGHADDLGSDEYNLALGMQRASAVRRFFAQRDIAEDRIAVVSLGEERPTCTDPDESCRRRNRRAEFRITAGLDSATTAVRGG